MKEKFKVILKWFVICIFFISLGIFYILITMPPGFQEGEMQRESRTLAIYFIYVKKFKKVCGTYPLTENWPLALVQKPEKFNCPKYPRAGFFEDGEEELKNIYSKNYKYISNGQDVQFEYILSGGKTTIYIDENGKANHKVLNK